MRAWLVITLTGMFCALPAEAKTRANPHLVQARKHYQALEFEECLQRIPRAEARRSTPKEQVQIQVYAGLCAYNIGRTDEATARFERAVELNPDVSLPPRTSPKIVALLERVRQSAAPADISGEEDAALASSEATEATDSDAPTDASQRSGDARSQTPDRTVADLTPPELIPTEAPVRAGLLDTAEPRSYAAPIALGAAAAAAGGAAAWFGLQARSLEAQANAARFESDGYALGDRARQQATLANVGFGVAIAAASGAVATWLLSGEE